MKTIPFNLDFKTDEFILTLDIFERGYYPLSSVPDIQSVSLIVEGVNNIIYPQYLVVEVTEEFQSLFPDVDLGTWVVTWSMIGSESSSSANPCVLEDPINDLLGTSYAIMEQNIGKTVHIRYVSE